MKAYRVSIVFIILVLLGGLLGVYLSPPDSGPLPEPEEEAQSTPAPVLPDKPQEENKPEVVERPAPDFPPGAIEGEYVIHFADLESYRAYFAALRAAGHEPLGGIEELLAVRIPQEAYRSIDFGQYDGRAGYSHKVTQPLPPVNIDPAALAGLRAFGASARSVVKGLPHGDGSGLMVAILDSGIEAHPQFDEVNMTKVDLVGKGVSGPGADHGTSVASIISGKEGIAPQAELCVLRVLDDQGLGNSYHVAEGIVQAVDLGAKVINLSLGVYQDSMLLRQAIEYARKKDVVLVAAAGNEGYNRIPYPAAYDEVLAVTALDAKGNQAVFPNQSDKIDFAAPGVGIRTAKGDEGDTLFSGTSAAAPFVTGTLASFMSGEDAMSPAEAVDLMRRYLNDAGAPGTDPVYGAGVLDWDRLRERSNPEIIDIALADIYLSPEALPGTNMPLSVTVQNRGTKWLNQGQLEVLVGKREPVKFTIGTLGPGQITTRKVYAQLPSASSDEVLNIAARVLTEDLNDDVRLENNLKALQFRPNQPGPGN